MADKIHFTEAQEAALDLSCGKIVLAGAGSGKTTVLTERYLRLLTEKEVEPRNIIAVTFTRKAAAQLFAKVHRKLLEREQTGDNQATHWRKLRENLAYARIDTIHGLCASFLRAYPMQAGVDPGFDITQQADVDLKEAVHHYLRRLAYEKNEQLREMLNYIGDGKTIEQLILHALSRFDLLDALEQTARHSREAEEFFNSTLKGLLNQISRDPSVDKSKIANKIPLSHDSVVSRFLCFKSLVDGFTGRRGVSVGVSRPTRLTQRLSFDDLQSYTLRLFRNHPEVLSQIQKSVRYLMVDEFQDTSTIQWEILRSLATDENGRLIADKLFLVGDEKQSIYGFRDANVTILERAKREFADYYGNDPENASRYLVNLNDNFRTLPELIEPMNLIFQRLLTSSARPYSFEAAPQNLIARRRSVSASSPLLEIALGYNLSTMPILIFLVKRLRREVETGIPIVDPEGDGNEIRPLKYEDIALLIRTRTGLDEIEEAFRLGGAPFQVMKGRGYYQRQETIDMTNLITALADPRDLIAWVGTLRSPLFNLSDTAIAMLFLGGSDPKSVWKSLATGQKGSTGFQPVMGRMPMLDEIDAQDLAAIRDSYYFWQELEQRHIHHSPAELLQYTLERRGAWAAYAVGSRGEQQVANLFKFIQIVRELASQGGFTLRRLLSQLRDLAELEDEGQDQEAEITAGEGVRIYTIHGAKGLEFPYIVLADLARQKRKQSRISSFGNLLVPSSAFSPLTDPHLAPLGCSKNTNEFSLHDVITDIMADVEERAELKRMLYVSATRARDRLLLISRAPSDLYKKNYSDSALAHWMYAYGIEVSREGAFSQNRDLADCYHFRLLTPDDCELESAASPSEAILSDEIPKVFPEAEADPGVRLSRAPQPDRLVLPITGFAAYLSDTSEQALSKLFWFSSSLKETEETEINDFALTKDLGLVEKLHPSLNDPDLLREIGILVHDIYNKASPGCTWKEAQELVETWLRRKLYSDNQADAIKSLIKLFLDQGRNLGLHQLPAGAKREIPVLYCLEDALLRGRVDLAWKEGDYVFIVDYKTNVVSEKDLDLTVEKHGYFHQAKLYGLALMRAWNVQNAIARFVFLYPGSLRAFSVVPEDENFYKSSLQAAQML